MANTPQTPGFRPLYRQVKDVLISRIVSGEWKPGSALPSEIRLARELKVSQGTVRKALDSMSDEKLLFRRQGRGTFVAEHNEERYLFQYFKFRPDSGERRLPDSSSTKIARLDVDEVLAGALEVEPGSGAWVIKRVRHFDEVPVIAETIFLPCKVLPALDEWDEIPDNLYETYSREAGITITRAMEKIKAISADDTLANTLDCEAGHPVLKIYRQAIALDGSVTEIRISNCLTDHYHYLSELS